VSHAHELGHFFQLKQIRAIFTSPIKRAMQTAQIIASHLNLPIQTDERFGEIKNPVLEGTKRDQAAKCLYTLPGGEKEADIRSRMQAGLDDVLRTRVKTIIVSHGDPITILLYSLLNQETPISPSKGEDCYIRKGEIVKLEFSPTNELIDWESINLNELPKSA